MRPCRQSTTGTVGELLVSIAREHDDPYSPAIDPAAWDAGIFHPIPPIIDAAVRLYSENEVFEIGHACAARRTSTKPFHL
ncbi:MAG TPA: hypothetical protein VGS78_05765 [Candidatus Sulfotelmatobacter sp.]|nr:hypothetical protein [Candidatus Sulfotelmatobacter sp.]